MRFLFGIKILNLLSEGKGGKGNSIPKVLIFTKFGSFLIHRVRRRTDS